jgi:hypothetical protein
VDKIYAGGCSYLIRTIATAYNLTMHETFCAKELLNLGIISLLLFTVTSSSGEGEEGEASGHERVGELVVHCASVSSISQMLGSAAIINQTAAIAVLKLIDPEALCATAAETGGADGEAGGGSEADERGGGAEEEDTDEEEGEGREPSFFRKVHGLIDPVKESIEFIHYVLFLSAILYVAGIAFISVQAR